MSGVSKFADWPENLPREDLIRLLRGYADMARRVEQIIADAFPDQYPLGDGDVLPSDQRLVIDEDAVAMAEKAVVEIERLRVIAGHACNPPDRGIPGDKWRCDCGRRWRCMFEDDSVDGVTLNRAVWQRKYWPWPR